MHCQDGIELSDDIRSATTSGRRCCPGGSPQIAWLHGNLIGGFSGEQPEGRNFAVAKGWNYDQEGSSDPHPIIPIRPVKIQYTPNCYSCCTHTHTYTHHAILLGCFHMYIHYVFFMCAVCGGMRRPRNL